MMSHTVDDMTTISDLDIEKINLNLEERYKQDVIYTNSGSILIAVNPYKELNIYGQEQIARYHTIRGGNPPHIYHTAESAYTTLKRISTCLDIGKVNQSVVISGESGAGKTETTKFILNYLCQINQNQSNNKSWVQYQILEANTILEAFGNAKTVRNDNSSRFGKFMRVCFDSNWVICGCVIQDYLLEQSRITFQSNSEEKNYHVFYILTDTAQQNKELASQYHLVPTKQYNYLNKYIPRERINWEDQQRKFDNLRLAFNIVQINNEFIDGIFIILSAILWLGNLEFDEVEDGEQCQFSPKDDQIIQTISTLLGVAPPALKAIMLKRQINVCGNITEIPLKFQEAKENRHAMAKALYSYLFSWLINHINKCTNPTSQHKKSPSTKFIGLLDIFGFENFPNQNSFEQLCINYTNEKLHKFFNYYVFSIEQEIYRHEGIQFKEIEFTDNSTCLELIEKPPKCLLKLLTEQCHLPKGSDQSYLIKLNQEFESHPCYRKSDDRRRWELDFTILHYASPVTYSVQGFVDKNRNNQQDPLFHLVENSHNPVIHTVFNSGPEHENTSDSPKGTMTMSKGKHTISDTFRQQLQALVDVLQSTTPWYVRCIKPNMTKKPSHFDTSLVLDQLKYLGMAEIIRIRREGYPIHYNFGDFIHKYCFVISKLSGQSFFYTGLDSKNFARNLMETFEKAVKLPKNPKVSTRDWQIGNEKIFLRHSVSEPLEKSRYELVHSMARKIQTWWRALNVRKVFKKQLHAAIIIQTCYRRWKERFNYLRRRRAAITIQCHLRGMFAREAANSLRELKRVEHEIQWKELMKLNAEEDEDTGGEDGAINYNNLLHFLNDDSSVNKDTTTTDDDYEEDEICSTVESSTTTVIHSDEYDEEESGDNYDIEDNCARLLNGNVNNGAANNNTKHNNNTNNNKNNNMVTKRIAPTPPTNNNNVPLPPPLPPPQFSNNATTTTTHQSVTANSAASALVAKRFVTGPPRLPEPNCAPPPVPKSMPPSVVSVTKKNIINATKATVVNHPATTNNTTKSATSSLNSANNTTNSASVNQSIKQRKGGQNGEEPIYESIQPRMLTNGAPQKVTSQMNGLNGHVPIPPSHPPPQLIIQKKPPKQLQQQQQVESKKIESTTTIPTSTTNTSTTNGTNTTATKPNPANVAVNCNGVSKHDENDVNNEDEEDDPEENKYYDMIEFAEKYFNPFNEDVKYLKRRESKEKSSSESNNGSQNNTKFDMISYTKSHTITNSHVHLFDPENVQIALGIFKELHKYMRTESLKESTDLIQAIINYGIKREELRDEIYIQIIRQITNNPYEEQIGRLWLLLSLVIIAFSSSKMLHKYVKSFIRKSLHLQGRTSEQMKWCLDNCSCISCPRLFPPSTVEISAMKKLGTILCRFYFLDGRTKILDIYPKDTVADTITKLSQKINLFNTTGWALYQYYHLNGILHEEHLPQHYYIYDVISGWEINSSDNKSSNRFIFKKRLFTNITIPQDPVEINLLYAQAVFSVTKKDEFPVTEKAALQLAGLQAQVLLGDQAQSQEGDYYVEYYLHDRILRCRPFEHWQQILAHAHKQYGSGKADLMAKVCYLTSCMKYPLYGTTTFTVLYRGYWPHGNKILLGVNNSGILMIKEEDKFVINEYSYKEINSIHIDAANKLITLQLNKCFIFETKSCMEIGKLICSYYPLLASSNDLNAGNPTNNTANKQQQGGGGTVPETKRVTNQDRLRLYQTVVNCRQQLVMSGLLLKPTTFFKNTLRRISKSLKQYDKNNEDDFNYAYWAFTKYPLSQSLTQLNSNGSSNGNSSSNGSNNSAEDQELTTLSLEMFQLILTYSGLLNMAHRSSQEKGEDQGIKLLQQLLEKCWSNDKLLDELYMQLIKQTTDYPEPNSKINCKNWSALCLLCSLLQPNHGLVKKYLMCHLKKCSIDYVTQEGVYSRFAEKCLQQTARSTLARRQWLPCKQEVMCTISCKPISSRFYLMDNKKFHILHFSVNETAQDLLQSILYKIGIEAAKGYSIYESSVDWERSLLPEERPVEVMSRWEKQKATGFKFVVKKHLFKWVNMDNPIEKELIYYQLLSNTKNDRFPINDTEAAMLVALQAQIELGDFNTSKVGEFPDYCFVSSHCLPTRIAASISHESVARHHQSLIGSTVESAKQSVLNLLTSWPLHFSTIFEVTQSFTSNWPRHLWISIDQKGIHLLPQKTRHVLCSFNYSSLVDYNPLQNCLMLIIKYESNLSKVILSTNQSFQIIQLIKEYATNT